jgi:hypothetical protein
MSTASPHFRTGKRHPGAGDVIVPEIAATEPQHLAGRKWHIGWAAQRKTPGSFLSGAFLESSQTIGIRSYAERER